MAINDPKRAQLTLLSNIGHDLERTLLTRSSNFGAQNQSHTILPAHSYINNGAPDGLGQTRPVGIGDTSIRS